jgi:hypothetical protein
MSMNKLKGFVVLRYRLLSEKAYSNHGFAFKVWVWLRSQLARRPMERVVYLNRPS